MAVTKGTAQTYTVLHHFTGNDGSGPWGSLVSSGTTLYGTTRYHSAYRGTVFKINTDGSGYAVLHTFSGSDGSDPTGILALSGRTLYGTTLFGGSSPDPGTVFKINMDGSGFSVLKAFGGSDGRWPGSLMLSGTTLYGTTGAGGTAGDGTVFKLNTDGSGYTVLHNFTGYPNDGRWPDGALLLSGTMLYGATPLGGGNAPRENPEGCGTLFQIQIDGGGYTILRHFTRSDGWAPYGGLVLSDRTFYGITEGGYSAAGNYSGGTVFSMNTDGTAYFVLHNFAVPPGGGAVPYGGLASSGTTLYGATTQGGSYGYSPSTQDYGYGTVFQIDLDGSRYGLLKEFSGEDGAMPYAGVLVAGTRLYGTTSSGGISNAGVVFSLSPAPVIQKLSPSQTAEAGSPMVRLSAHAESDTPMTYEWFFSATNIVAVGSNPLLLLTNVQPAQAGAYTLVITNVFAAVTSPPVMLSVIPPVSRKTVPVINLTGDLGTLLHLSYADTLGQAASWLELGTVTLTNAQQAYVDLSEPLPLSRVYRAWQTNVPSVMPVPQMNLATEIPLTGAIGDKVRIDYINQFGPIDSWVTLDTITLASKQQLYFDFGMFRQPARLYRLVPVP